MTWKSCDQGCQSDEENEMDSGRKHVWEDEWDVLQWAIMLRIHKDETKLKTDKKWELMSSGTQEESQIIPRFSRKILDETRVRETTYANMKVYGCFSTQFL